MDIERTPATRTGPLEPRDAEPDAAANRTHHRSRDGVSSRAPHRTPRRAPDRTTDDVPLRARGVDDLLGYTGHVLGTLPADSLVFLTLSGDGLRAVIRVDRPATSALADPERARRWAGAVAGVCLQDTEASAVVALVLDGRTGEGGDALPRAGAEVASWWWRLEDALTLAGLPVREAWAVSGGHAWPWPAHPFADPEDAVPVEPRTSDLSLHLVSRGSVWGLRDEDATPPPLRTLSAGAEPAPAGTPGGEGAHAPGGADTQTRGRATGDPGEWTPPAREDEAARHAWLQEWEAVLSGARQTASGEIAALRELGAPLAIASWRDALLLHTLVGTEAEHLDRAARERLLTGSSGERPPWRRMDRLWDALRLIAGAAPERVAAQALATAGWLAWARGQGSAAGAHVEAAARLTPHDGFVTVLIRLVDSGTVCRWATDPAHAWRP